MSHILIAGLGDLGRGLAENLLAAGHRVSGIRRGSDAPSGVDLYSQDLLDGARLLPPDRVDLLVIIMTPSEYSEEGYLKAYVRAPLNLLDALAEQQPLPPILFVSSSAVFGDLEGDVDETTPPAPTRYNGKVVLAAEQEISTRGLTTVVRFSGIYGPGRSRLLTKVARMARDERRPSVPPVRMRSRGVRRRGTEARRVGETVARGDLQEGRRQYGTMEGIKHGNVPEAARERETPRLLRHARRRGGLHGPFVPRAVRRGDVILSTSYYPHL